MNSPISGSSRCSAHRKRTPAARAAEFFAGEAVTHEWTGRDHNPAPDPQAPQFSYPTRSLLGSSQAGPSRRVNHVTRLRDDHRSGWHSFNQMQPRRCTSELTVIASAAHLGAPSAVPSSQRHTRPGFDCGTRHCSVKNDLKAAYTVNTSCIAPDESIRSVYLYKGTS